MSRQLILDTFDGKKTDRVPVGLWWHYTTPNEWVGKRGDAETYERITQSHLNYAKEVKLDLLKVMPDLYFLPNNLDDVELKDPAQLEAVKPLGVDAPYYDEQVRLIRYLHEALGEQAAIFPTIFSPSYYISFTHAGDGDFIGSGDLEYALKHHPGALKKAVDVVTEDIIALVKKELTYSGATGIFLAVHALKGFDKEDYQKIFGQAEKRIAEEAAAISNYTILHVCGGFGKKNDFSLYEEYPYKALNYSVESEGFSIREAKEKFPDKAIIGGFSNRKDGVLHTGTKEEIQAETRRLVEEAGRDRYVVGADCSLVTGVMTNERVSWVKEVADTL